MVHYETYSVDPDAIMLFLVEPMAQQWASQTCLALWLTLKTMPYLTRNALAGGRKLQTYFNKYIGALPCLSSTPYTLHMSCMILPYYRSTQDMTNVMMSCDQDVTTGLLLRGIGS